MAEEPNVKDPKAGKPWSKLVELPLNTESFKANGRQYRVHRSVSFDRWEAYEILQVEIGLARTYQQLMDGLREAYDLCNQVATGKHVFADLSVTLRDLIIGTSLVGEKQTPAVLKMAALFICREDEDVRFIDEALIEAKVEDWRIEGISMTYFFQFALHSIPGFFEAYRIITRDTSKGPIQEGRAVKSTSKSASKR